MKERSETMSLRRLIGFLLTVTLCVASPGMAQEPADPILSSVLVGEAAAAQTPSLKIESVSRVSAAAYTVAIQGRYAYFVDRAYLTIADVSDPLGPAIVSQMSMSGDFDNDISVVGNYAYAVGWDGLQIINTSDPTHPTQSGFCSPARWATSIVVRNNLAYVSFGATDVSSPGLRIIDVSDSARPAEIGNCLAIGGGADVAVFGNHAYLVGGNTALSVINVADPTQPVKVASWWTSGDAEGVAVACNYAYIAEAPNPGNGEGGGLRIFNVSNPEHTFPIGFYFASSSAQSARRVALVGSYALVTISGGILIVDVSDPTRPTNVGFYATPSYPWDLAIASSYTYVAAGDGGLLILRLLRDKVIGSIPLSGGSLTSTSRDTSFVFPTEAFTAIVNLTYRHLWMDRDTGALAGIGRTFDLSAVYSDTGQVAELAPGQTYSVIVHYTDAEKGGAIESTLALYGWDGSQWVKEPGSVVDTAANMVMAAPNHLGLFAVLGETQRLFLPVIRRG